MSENADTFTLLSSQWKKTLIHSHFWFLDWQEIGKNANTLTLLSSRWANTLIHSHFWNLDDKKPNVCIISFLCSACGFSYCPAHLNFLIKSFKEITFFLQTLPSPLPAAVTKQNAETFNVFLRRPFKIRKYSRLPRPPRRGGADPLKQNTKEIMKKWTLNSISE